MLTITKQAAIQIQTSTDGTDNEGLPLRVAARRSDDGSIQYVLGFDAQREGDMHIESEGVDIIIDESGKELLMGTEIDFVEYEPGDFRFIFLNPNDPNFVPPKEDE